jgi:hypothetical protein
MDSPLQPSELATISSGVAKFHAAKGILEIVRLLVKNATVSSHRVE